MQHFLKFTGFEVASLFNNLQKKSKLFTIFPKIPQKKNRHEKKINFY